MPWWGWLLLGLAFLRLRHWRAYGTCGMRRHRVHGFRMDGWGPNVIVIDGRRGCGSDWRGRRSEPAREPEPEVELSAADRRERAMAELRRRYVADDITVEEYERELDRLLREEV
jgi:hypothetical protein